MTMGVNHLGHFLLCNLLLEDMSRAKNARLCIVGSVTGNTNTIGGGLVYPRADLGDLQGFDRGGTNPVAMADGAAFFGAKAYKDSKVCNMMTLSELHGRYHNDTGIVFSSLYPGCVAETNLFREKRPWFQKAFPWFMKYVTKAYVSETEAGERVAQVISDDRTGVSGKYWSWSGAGGSGGAGGAGHIRRSHGRVWQVLELVRRRGLWGCGRRNLRERAVRGGPGRGHVDQAVGALQDPGGLDRGRHVQEWET